MLRRGCHWALRRATLWAGVGVGGCRRTDVTLSANAVAGSRTSVHYVVHGAVDPLALASYSMSREEACILLERRGGDDLAALRTQYGWVIALSLRHKAAASADSVPLDIGNNTPTFAK